MTTPAMTELPEPELGYIGTDKSRQPAFSARQMREALQSARPAPPLPMTDEQFTQLLRKLKRSREVFQAGRDSYETACAPMNSDDEAWFAYLAHHGITQRADGGEQQA